jgi:putative addiction module component (TIGR02574 family)
MASDVFAKAMELSIEERAQLAHQLLVSLHEDERTKDPDQVAKAWASELERRMRDIDDGTVKTEQWSDVRKRISAQLEARRRR